MVHLKLDQKALVGILKGVFMILHDTLARREDTFKLQEKKDFLCSFVQHDGWRIQLLQIIQLIEIWDSIIKIVRYWEKLPKSK